MSICCSSAKTTSTEPLLPAGRLREAAGDRCERGRAARHGRVSGRGRARRAARSVSRRTFLLTRTIGPPRMVATGDSVVVPTDDPIFAVAGIARPERFFADLASAGWRVAGTLAFRDHHRFDAHDVDRIRDAARRRRAPPSC